MKHFFKVKEMLGEEGVTTRLEDSESSESEEEEKKETLNEKIDRFALENSEDDEDFDVSDQVSYFCLTSDNSFSLLPDAIVKFIESIQASFQSICRFEGNSVT